MNTEPIYSTILDDEPEFAPIVGRFVASLPSMLDGLRQAWEQHDWSRLSGIAHDLKGTAGNLGFPLLMRTAARIETNANQQNEASMEQLFAELQHMAARIAIAPP